MSQQVNLSTKVAKSDWNKKYFPEQAQSPAWDTTRTETDSEDDEDEYSLDDETFLQFSDDEEKEREEGDGREGRSKGGRYPEDQFSEDEKKGREWDYKGEVYPEEESGRKRPTMVTKPRVTVTFPPLPQVGTALQSNVRRLGRRKELQMMRREKLRWGFEKSSPLIAIGVEEAEGARQTQAREGGEGDKGRMGSIDTRASSSQGRRGRNYKKGYYQGGSLSIITIHKEYRFETEERSTPPHFPQALVTNDSAEGAGQESQPPPTSGEDAQLKQEDKRKTKTEKAGTSPAAAVGMGKLLELLWGITIPEEYTFETEQPGTPAHIPQSLVAGDSTDGAGQGLPPPPFSGDDAQLKQGGKRKNKTEEAGTSLAGGPAAAGVGKRRGLLWGRKKLLASPLLCDADAFDAYEGNGAFSQANIRIGFADGLFEYPLHPGYSWILQSMLSDPLVLPFEAYLYDVAKRPEFTVDCRWLTENDLFIIFDILTPGPETYGAPMAFCPITGEPVTLRRFRTPNNRPYLPLGGWTGDVVDSENNQFTYVERYFIWVNRDGSGVREGSARWPPASARKKRHLEKSSALPILSLPSGTPKEQYSVVIGLDNGLEKDHKNGEQPECTRSHPKCLKTLEKHIKVKLETDKIWLQKMIDAPAYWIVQEIIATLLDGQLKGLLAEARNRVNKQRKKALIIEPIARAIHLLTNEVDMMQELVGIMEEYIQFVSSFELAYHSFEDYSSDSATATTLEKEKEAKQKKLKLKGIPPPDKVVRRRFMMLRKTLEGYRDSLVDIKGDLEYTINMILSTVQANESSVSLRQSGMGYYQAEKMKKQSKPNGMRRSTNIPSRHVRSEEGASPSSIQENAPVQPDAHKHQNMEAVPIIMAASNASVSSIMGQQDMDVIRSRDKGLLKDSANRDSALSLPLLVPNAQNDTANLEGMLKVQRTKTSSLYKSVPTATPLMAEAPASPKSPSPSNSPPQEDALDRNQQPQKGPTLGSLVGSRYSPTYGVASETLVPKSPATPQSPGRSEMPSFGSTCRHNQTESKGMRWLKSPLSSHHGRSKGAPLNSTLENVLAWPDAHKNEISEAKPTAPSNASLLSTVGQIGATYSYSHTVACPPPTPLTSHTATTFARTPHNGTPGIRDAAGDHRSSGGSIHNVTGNDFPQQSLYVPPSHTPGGTSRGTGGGFLSPSQTHTPTISRRNSVPGGEEDAEFDRMISHIEALGSMSFSALYQQGAAYEQRPLLVLRSGSAAPIFVGSSERDAYVDGVNTGSSTSEPATTGDGTEKEGDTEEGTRGRPLWRRKSKKTQKEEEAVVEGLLRFERPRSLWSRVPSWSNTSGKEGSNETET